MDYVGGGDLRRAVLAGELAQEKVLPVILAVGGALAYAHEKGVIHRDVKPANILLDRDQPNLTDFDLVRAFDTTGGTQTQGMLGTVLYAAPEMLGDAKNASAAADVYSLAMTPSSPSMARICRPTSGAGRRSFWRSSPALRRCGRLAAAASPGNLKTGPAR
jgi:serine/threonine protein kinase